MSATLIEFFETFQAVQRARMVIAHTCLFGIAVRDALVTFDDGFHRGFTLAVKRPSFSRVVMICRLSLSASALRSAWAAAARSPSRAKPSACCNSFLERMLELPRPVH